MFVFSVKWIYHSFVKIISYKLYVLNMNFNAEMI